MEPSGSLTILLTKAHHWSLSFARYIKSTPTHPISIEIYFTYALVLTVVSFFHVSPPKPCLHFSPMYTTCWAHLILTDLLTLITCGAKSKRGSRLCKIFQPLVISSLLRPIILSPCSYCKGPSFSPMQHETQANSSINFNCYVSS
jgi:hypothetical protein